VSYAATLHFNGSRNDVVNQHSPFHFAVLNYLPDEIPWRGLASFAQFAVSFSGKIYHVEECQKREVLYF